MSRAFAGALVVLGLLLVPRAGWALNVGQKAPFFKLKTPSGKVYTLRSFKKRIFTIWYEGPKSIEQNRWLKKAFRRARVKGLLRQTHYDSIGIANYVESAIPNALINMVVKREIKKNPGLMVLVDPDGRMQRLYGFRNGRSNIFVFDQNRRLIWKSSGPLTRKRGRQLLRFIIRLTR